MSDYSLHKQLYELSGLEGAGDGVFEWVLAHEEYELDNGTQMNKEHPPFPRYTSDYLLEVLPKSINIDEISAALVIESVPDSTLFRSAYYSDGDAYYEEVDNHPLEALLKLAIKLIEQDIWSPKDD